MKLSVALFFAGIFGALAAVFVVLAFGTDYWLLASESCPPEPGSIDPATQRGDMDMEVDLNDVTLYHEGFFWRCSFGGNQADNDLMWKLWFTKQPQSKVCVPAYLFPFPVTPQTHNATAYESALIYRGFWSVFLLLAVGSVLLAGFTIICAAPFTSPRLYKAGGGLFLTAGLLLLCVLLMSVLWLEALEVVGAYVEHQRSALCADFQLALSYGLSFMFAPVGAAFCLLASLLFLLIGHSLQVQCQ